MLSTGTSSSATAAQYRSTSTRVFPLPAPASQNTSRSRIATAAACSGLGGASPLRGAAAASTGIAVLLGLVGGCAQPSLEAPDRLEAAVIGAAVVEWATTDLAIAHVAGRRRRPRH